MVYINEQSIPLHPGNNPPADIAKSLLKKPVASRRTGHSFHKLYCMSKSQDLTPAQRATLKRIGTKLKETREKQGRSIESVAAEAGIAIELLYAIEAGREEVILESLAWISALYGASHDDVWQK